jgi:hypothetical protein
VQAALHQDARAAERDSLVNLLANLFDGADVGVWFAGATVEGAESADDVADVRVIDVAINDVGDDARRVSSLANLVGGDADARDVVRF